MEKNELGHISEQLKLTCDDMQQKIELINNDNKNLI
jgi:hypothetical protein